MKIDCITRQLLRNGGNRPLRPLLTQYAQNHIFAGVSLQYQEEISFTL